MGAQYQVVSHAVVMTRNSVNGPMRMTLYRGALVSEESGATAAEIAHNLGAGYIVEVAGDAVGGLDAAGLAIASTPSSPPVEDDEQLLPAAADGDDEEESAGELPTDGSPPPQAAAKALWVDYAVSKGMDRGEADKASKADLIAALKD